MKIRNGFVSNSSSSSFCIYGTEIKISEEDLDQEKLKTMSIRIVYGPYDSVFLGRDWTSIEDDETGRQFKEKVEKEVEELLGEKKECSSYEEGWYNG